MIKLPALDEGFFLSVERAGGFGGGQEDGARGGNGHGQASRSAEVDHDGQQPAASVSRPAGKDVRHVHHGAGADS
ncbi:hypothetical protein [Streptomyces sp. NPDC005262]|uniref:hypothetical protein n=1 Tax=Streptomyces sp. NPDC005262 TaxID=3364710 RepID=UPI00368D9FF0